VHEGNQNSLAFHTFTIILFRTSSYFKKLLTDPILSGRFNEELYDEGKKGLQKFDVRIVMWMLYI